jgi:hypothetical protein
MYIMATLLVAGFIANALVRPLDETRDAGAPPVARRPHLTETVHE